MYIILHGPPGAGKGTQSENLCEQFGIKAIAAGDELRAIMKDESSELGTKIKTYVDAGNLVPDALVMDVIANRISQPDCANGFILDGYPRTQPQVEHLQKWLTAQGKSIQGVFSLNITDEESMVRCSMRLTCKNPECKKNFHLKYNLPKIARRYVNEEDVATPIFECGKCGTDLYMRSDADPKKIQTRIDNYHSFTEPIIATLSTMGWPVFEIDGMKKPDDVTAEINTVIQEKFSS